MLAIFFVGGLAFGYDNMVIHPKLSNVAVEIYNREAEKKITSEESAWIIAGAIAEDTDPRYLNHFYNPATGKGLKYLGVEWPSARDWMKKQNSATGDYSVGAVLENYRLGNSKRAWQGIGHILHLFQDMAVPAHTRLDPHADGDLYEGWAWGNGNIQADQIQKTSVNDLSAAMAELAAYTKNNFYSKDTIYFQNFNQYRRVTQIVDGKERIYLINSINGEEYKVAFIKNINPVNIEYSIKDDSVHQDYWRLLAPQAAGYSAGVIEWFANEFKKIDQEKAAGAKSLLGAIKGSLARIGDIFRAPESLAYVWGDVYRPAREEVFEKGKEVVDTGKIAVETLKNSAESGKENALAAVNAGLEAAADMGEGMAEGVKVLGEMFTPPLLADNQDPRENNNKPGRVLSAFEKNEAGSGQSGLARVIDGDTIELLSGEKVRYIGADTPELGVPGPQDDECLAWVARMRNEQLLKSGELKLVADPGGERDKYGRLLRYVYAGDIFINERLTKEGLATVFFCQPGWENCPLAEDGVRQAKIKAAADDAVKNKRGLFSGVCDPAPEKIEPDETPAGNETEAEAPLLTKKPVILFGSGPSVSAISGEGEEEVVETGEGDGAAAEPLPAELPGPIADFYLYDLLTNSRAYSASNTVGVYAEAGAGRGAGTGAGEYLILPAGPAPDIYGGFWSDAWPSFYNLAAGDGLKEICLWQKSGESLISSGSAAIILDTTAPTLEFYVRPDIFSSAHAAVFFASSSEPLFNFSCHLDLGGFEPAILLSELSYSDLAEGGHELVCEAIDLAGNASVLSFAWTLDFTPPSAAIASLEAENGFIEAAWGGDDSGIESDVAGFDLEFSLDGGDWQEWLTGTSAVAAVLRVEESGTYVVRVRARDRAGNIGEWSELVAVTIAAETRADHIVLSEVAVNGPNGAADEFIELYNPTDKAVNLDKWKIYTASSNGKTWNKRTGTYGLYGVIPPGGYFLVSSKNYTLSRYPDFRHTANFELANEGGHVRLNDASDKQVDLFAYGSAAKPETAAFLGDLSSGSAERHPVSGDTDNNRDDFIWRPAPDPRNALIGTLLYFWRLNEGMGGTAFDSGPYGENLVLPAADWMTATHTPFQTTKTSLRINNAFMDKDFSTPISVSDLTLSFWYRHDPNTASGSATVAFKNSRGENEFGLNLAEDRITLYIRGEAKAIDWLFYDGEWDYISLAYGSLEGRLRLFMNAESIYETDMAADDFDLSGLRVGADDFAFELYRLYTLEYPVIPQVRQLFNIDICSARPDVCIWPYAAAGEYDFYGY